MTAAPAVAEGRSRAHRLSRALMAVEVVLFVAPVALFACVAVLMLAALLFLFVGISITEGIADAKVVLNVLVAVVCAALALLYLIAVGGLATAYAGGGRPALARMPAKLWWALPPGVLLAPVLMAQTGPAAMKSGADVLAAMVAPSLLLLVPVLHLACARWIMQWHARRSA